MRRATGHCKVSTILGLRRSLRVSELERGVSVDLGWPRAWRPIEYHGELINGGGFGGEAAAAGALCDRTTSAAPAVVGSSQMSSMSPASTRCPILSCCVMRLMPWPISTGSTPSSSSTMPRSLRT